MTSAEHRGVDASSSDPSDAPPFDAAAVQAFREAWVYHERWFQLGGEDVASYSWPVPGTRFVYREGREAYFAYRDFVAGFIMAVDGYAELLDDLRTIARAALAVDAREPRRLLREALAQDATFAAQWENVFHGPVVWPGVTHDALTAYARKYEVVWPLAVLACLDELRRTGRYDATLRGFRDARGRLVKGKLVNAVRAGFGEYRALRGLLDQAYSPTLRNLIQHNDYVIAGDTLRSIDGSFTTTEQALWDRVHALSAIQNALIWFASTVEQDGDHLARRGLLGVAWQRPTANAGVDEVPCVLLLQLAAYRQHDRAASWVNAAVVTIEGDEVRTAVGSASAHGGPVVAELVPMLRRLDEVRRLRCVVLGLVPCLHAEDADHDVFALPDGRFCEALDRIVRVVPVDLQGSVDLAAELRSTP